MEFKQPKLFQKESLEKLCIDLAHAETEDDVISILKEEDYWDDPSAWRYYGDKENNFATIGNQQSRPEAALVEKIINSVDAVLMAECASKGIDAESQEAPACIPDALNEFYGIRDGKLSNLGARERTRLAENICLVATGAKNNPCYSIIDKGEGQTPGKMPTTLLSIGESNKLRIPFVQGKFNMGGTGVLQFCGRHNLQLIISKRNPEVAKHDIEETSTCWGFTIVRRDDPNLGVRSSTYRYLAPNNEILSFESDGLPLLPGAYPIAYEEELAWGTFIKLYEYQMTGLKTNILFDLYNRLSLLMPTIALPVRFFERRLGYAGHTFETTLSGLTVRLDEDRSENLEDGFPTSAALSAHGEKMRASIYAFKRGQSQKYTKDEGVIFTINGQTHGHLPKAFYSRKSVSLGYLADSVLVILDCSEFDGRAREDLFMNSRDRIRSTELRAEIERNLEDLLKNHQGLKDLREQRRREDIENKLEDSKPLAEIIENIMKKSPTLAKLFIAGVRLPNPFKSVKAKPSETYEGKEFPTVFKLIHEFDEEDPKNCPNNVKMRIQYKTDATNDYFDRDSNPGSFKLIINGTEIMDYSLNLWNGYANLNVSLKSARVDEVLHFESAVDDIARAEPFMNEFFVKVIAPVAKTPSETSTRKPPASTESGGDADKPSMLDLPNVIEVRRDDWDTRGFDEDSALAVLESGEDGYDFYVNMDNIHLRTEQKSSTSIDPKLLDARYKYGMVLMGIAFLKEDESKGEAEHDDDDVFSIILKATRIVSPILLPMIASLGDLEIEEATN